MADPLLADDVATALRALTAALPGGGEERRGQVAMAEAVGSAIAAKRHLVAQAGTGTGKSLAYLVPAILSGRPTVVATATKALQDQLAGKDLPFLARHLPRPFTFAVLKGRANYVCRQRVAEVTADGADGQLGLDGLAERAPQDELDRLVAWAADTPTGDRADLDAEPSPAAWAAVSVSSRDCPGAARCPQGASCLAEAAREAAEGADVIVVNTHLYGLHLASGGSLLPDHEVVVLDEAHSVEDVISATAGLELGAGRFVALARVARAILADEVLLAEVEGAGRVLTEALAPHAGHRLRIGADEAVTAALALARARVERLLAALRGVADREGDVGARRLRALTAAAALVEELDAITLSAGTDPVDDDDVAWVEGPPSAPLLRVAPVDVGRVLRDRLWGEVTAVLTSATVPPGLPERLGLDAGTFDQLDVGSPFPFDRHALLYCAAHLPDPRQAGFADAVHVELEALITAAGGRTLALFTSWRAMEAAAEALIPELAVPVLTQHDLPKPALLAAFAGDEGTCLFATLGFWQGVDIPGPSLSLVTIDRLPFPRPDEPLLQARRERARGRGFATVDLPRAATLLAQGAGRLVRSNADRGVVAVLDPRLARASYRWDIVRALPPMRRTKDRAEVEAFLRSLADRTERADRTDRTDRAAARAG